MSLVAARLSIGDRIPAFNLPSQTGEFYNIGDFLGKPLIIYFFPKPLSPETIVQARALQDILPQFQAMGVSLIGISPESVEALQAFANQNHLTFPLLSDINARVFADYGVASSSVSTENQTLTAIRKALIVDLEFRILKIYDSVELHTHPSQLLADLKTLLATEVPRHILIQAPVLLISNVFEPEFCQELIDIWHTQGNGESGFMRQVEGKTVGLVDYSHKIRRDHFLQEGEIKEKIKTIMGRRVTPAIWKAFNFNATRFEDFRIVCYDASCGGYFRPHRDNTTSATAHRRFAMTINLNAGEYEGGYLRFPEFGPHLYRPDTGCAVIFSCSLLHEATDLTAGRRFALLSFFYGEAEAKKRQDYLKREQKEENQSA